MNRLIISLIFSLFTLTAVRAQSNYWEEILKPYGGECTLVKTTGGQLYAAGSIGKNVYRSDDGGNHWVSVYHQITPSFYFSVSSTGKFYKKSGGTWLRSDNEGSTWTPMPANTNAMINIVETADGALVGQDAAYFYISQDGGTTWTPTSDLPSVDNLYINSIQITPYGGLLAITANSGFNTKATYYRSTDGGQTWQRLEILNSYAAPFITPTGTILAATYASLLRSTDMGLTFSPVNGPKVEGYRMQALPSGRIIAFGQDMMFYSDNDGLNWQSFAATVKSNWSMQPITPLADGTVFATGNNALFMSADGGEHWQFASVGIRDDYINSLRVYADSITYAANNSGVWKTTDTGLHWQRLTNDPTAQNFATFEVTPAGGVVFPEGNGLYYSANGDNPVTDITPPDSIFGSVTNHVFVNPWNSHLFCSTTAGVARSADLGQNWEPTEADRMLSRLGFHSTGRIFAIDHSTTLVFSDNEGITWDSIALPGALPCGDVLVAPNGDVLAVCQTGNGLTALFRSADAGNSWVQVSGHLPGIYFTSGNLIRIADNGHLLRSDGDYRLFLSADGGLTWQTLPEPTGIPGFSYTAHDIYMDADQYLYVNSFVGSFKTVHPVTQGAYISGHARLDADADCSTPDAQAPLKNWTVKASGEFDYYTLTDPEGRYTFFVDTGTYQVELTVPNATWWSVCDSTQSVTVDSLFAADSLDFAAFSASECPLMTVDVAMPLLRRCFDNTVYVQYCNQGSEPADSAWVDVTLDPYMTFVSSAQPHASLGTQVYRFFLGDVASGDCGQFTLKAYVECDSTVLGQTHCVTAHGYPDTLCTTVPNWSGAVIEALVECQDSLIQLKLRNAGNAPSQTLDYIIIEDDVVLMTGDKQYDENEELSLDMPANGHTWRIESEQEPGHPFSVQAVAFAEGCGGFESLGFINQFSVNTFQPSWNTACVENIGAYDPNDKQGFPTGFGTEHRIRPGQELEYMIRFQNTGTDTAFNIVILDSLSAWLDPASVRPGAASHPYTWELSGQGVLRFTFSNILLPDSNTSLAGSQGFVAFKIDQQPGVPLGTQILNTAAIYFDFNLPVITNQTLHTVGGNYIVGTTVPQTDHSAGLLTVSPNPVQDEAVFQLKSGAFNRHRIEVSDAYGRVLCSTVASGTQYLFQRKGLPNGVYFFRVEDAKGQLVDAGTLLLSGE